MKYLSFNDVKELCPAAATSGKGRRTTGDDYRTFDTAILYRRLNTAGWRCIDAMQGPSVKRSYEPFARHSMTFVREDARDDDAVQPRMIVTNSHNGLTPLMFVPAWHVAAFDATLYASCVAVLHRQFSDDGNFALAVAKAAATAGDMATALPGMWRRMQRTKLQPREVSAIFGRILRTHADTTVDIAPKQLAEILPPGDTSLGHVVAATVGGFTHGKFMATTPGGALRRVYAPRAIVRVERIAFGAWWEAVEYMRRHQQYGAAVPPFNATPIARNDDGTRRASAALLLTDKRAAEAAA